MDVIARACFAEAAKYALVTINHHERHPRSTAAVKYMVGITIDDIRGEDRIGYRLCRLDRCQ